MPPSLPTWLDSQPLKSTVLSLVSLAPWQASKNTRGKKGGDPVFYKQWKLLLIQRVWKKSLHQHWLTDLLKTAQPSYVGLMPASLFSFPFFNPLLSFLPSCSSSLPPFSLFLFYSLSFPAFFPLLFHFSINHICTSNITAILMELSK